MARDGGFTKKTKKETKKSPAQDSFTSVSRKNRGFKSLEQSSRKHRRAIARQTVARTFGGRVHEPGAKVSDGTSAEAYTAGGAVKFH